MLANIGRVSFSYIPVLIWAHHKVDIRDMEKIGIVSLYRVSPKSKKFIFFEQIFSQKLYDKTKGQALGLDQGCALSSSG